MVATLTHNPADKAATAATSERPIWYGHGGTKHYIDEMGTQHLFYCIRMVWNSTMPAVLTYGIRRPTNWVLDSRMLPYYRKVLPLLFDELSKRNDLTDAASVAELKLMQARSLQAVKEKEELMTRWMNELPK